MARATTVNKKEPKKKIPFGHCECGCGRRTAIARDTDVSKGTVKGEPRRFIPGHNTTGRLKEGDIMPHRKTNQLYIHGKLVSADGTRLLSLKLDQSAMSDLADLQSRRHTKTGLIFGATSLIKEALHAQNERESAREAGAQKG